MYLCICIFSICICLNVTGWDGSLSDHALSNTGSTLHGGCRSSPLQFICCIIYICICICFLYVFVFVLNILQLLCCFVTEVTGLFPSNSLIKNLLLSCRSLLRSWCWPRSFCHHVFSFPAGWFIFFLTEQTKIRF